MRVVEIERFGGPACLRDGRREKPTPGAGQLLVRVRAAGFNPVDYKWRQGAISPELPVVLGREVAGEVEAIGADVAGFHPGDRVVAWMGPSACWGGYAEWVAVPAAFAAPLPTRLSFAQGACLPIAGMTAWVAVMEKARVQAGEPVLVAGGAGGVGSFAVPLLLQIGAAPLFVTAGSEESAAWLVEQGVPCDGVVRYRGRAWQSIAAEVRERSGRGVAAAFDFVGGAMKRLCFDAVAPDGRVVSIVEEPAGFELDLWDERTSPLVLRSASFHFVQLGAPARLGTPAGWAAYGARLGTLARWIEQGRLPPPRVEVVGPLAAETVRRAHSRLEAGEVRGKLALVVD